MNSRPINHIKQLNFLFCDRVAQYIQLVLLHIIKCMLSFYFLSFIFSVGIPGIVGVILPAAEYNILPKGAPARSGDESVTRWT